jgi:hypothetical protein
MVPIELLTYLDTAVVPISDFVLLKRLKHTNMHSIFPIRMTHDNDRNVCKVKLSLCLTN